MNWAGESKKNVNAVKSYTSSDAVEINRHPSLQGGHIKKKTGAKVMID